MPSYIYEDDTLNSLGVTLKKEINTSLEPIFLKVYEKDISRVQFLRLLISTVLSFRSPHEFKKVVLNAKFKNQPKKEHILHEKKDS